MACPCPCCEKTGACCVDGSCTQETCPDCEALGGLWQGYDTECDGSDCPCDPPADHTLCEKCVDGVPEDRCGPGESCCDGVCCDKNCCDGVCQEEACGGGGCTVDIGLGTGSTDCAVTECCVDGECVAGYWVLDVGDCYCFAGDIDDGGYTYIDATSDQGGSLSDYGFTSWTLCCEYRDAEGFPACEGYPP